MGSGSTSGGTSPKFHPGNFPQAGLFMRFIEQIRRSRRRTGIFMRRVLTSLAIAFAAVGYLTTGPLALAGTVLCFGADGHIRYEVIGGAECPVAEREFSGSGGIASILPVDPCCGDCNDAQFSSTRFEKRIGLPAPDIGTNAGHVSNSDRFSTSVRLTVRPVTDEPRTALFSLRTTVLLV